ncbi:ribose 5-phosphate isomerase B [Ruthenibacterium sp. CLA-JM-H11]|uniref:Ribose 5-phosphate isomerase B n=1 Tax=Ruthenibacterium intestinale TaxID=3133163 RepID=A0ABV1GFP2_9FIRM
MNKPIALGADHGGWALKEAVKQHLDALGVAYQDFGTYSEESVDYPDMAVPPCEAVVKGECEKALLFCGTGVGISIAANKVKGIRACCCSDTFSAKYTRMHNDANVLCMGGRVVGAGLACELVDVFLNTEFEGGRHARRIAKITEIENR